MPSRRFPGPVIISTQSFVRKYCLRFGSFCVRGPCKQILHTARKHWYQCSKVVRGGGPSTAMFEPSERPPPPNRLQAQTWRKALACKRGLGARRLRASASRRVHACTQAPCATSALANGVDAAAARKATTVSKKMINFRVAASMSFQAHFQENDHGKFILNTPLSISQFKTVWQCDIRCETSNITLENDLGKRSWTAFFAALSAAISVQTCGAAAGFGS